MATGGSALPLPPLPPSGWVVGGFMAQASYLGFQHYDQDLFYLFMYLFVCVLVHPPPRIFFR